MKKGAEEPQSKREAVMEALHLLDSVTIPKNRYQPENGEYTRFSVIYNHGFPREVYFRTESRHSLFRLPFADVDFTIDAAQTWVPINVPNSMPWFIDAKQYMETL